MITNKVLSSSLHELLACEQFSDYAPNGLQVQGQENIKKIATAVTASLEVIERAVAMQAQALIVHHGYFWKGERSEIVGIKRERIAALLSHDINLFAYHLPLDCHPTLGNNAQLAKKLNLDAVQWHRIESINNLMCSANLPQPLSAEELQAYLSQRILRQPLHLDGGKKTIKKIAWCTGAAQDYLSHAYALGVDAYLSGEVSERTYYEAKELGIHYFACGHHATERYGIQALGCYLAQTYQLEHEFIDSSNVI